MKRYINTLLKFAYQIIAIIRKERYYLFFQYNYLAPGILFSS